MGESAKILNPDKRFFYTAPHPCCRDMKKAVELCRGKAETECSGNVTRENVACLVGIGVDYISSGALTHSSPILDLSLKNLHAI